MEVKIEGLAELVEAMKKLPEEVHVMSMRPAVSAAAGVVQKAARTLVPRDSGVLARSIYRTRSRSKSSKFQETAIVGVRFGRKYQKRKQDAWYWRFVEFGTSKMPARPFLRPAFENTKRQQLEAITRGLRIGIERAAQKLRKKA